MKVFNILSAYSAVDAARQNQDRLIGGRSPLSDLEDNSQGIFALLDALYGEDHVIANHWKAKLRRNQIRYARHFENCGSLNTSRKRRSATELDLTDPAIVQRDGDDHKVIKNFMNRFKRWAGDYLSECPRGIAKREKARAAFWMGKLQQRITRYRNRHG
ncbi:Oidioi.mRNA.OKI2018_I69.chr2.g4909.t1.cds [Oikopleura dioica]|uniref:Oidioi.mRNA.OKI2018_I69.chr2.g4909.t1.cds n=1 Tax=Oikopleura dioica TaxID=34765 RepID=A0ABN7T0D3_OIKDI|nr:Oidioi.mRNA.OKI2018_I69.chr2.g4909.t1.cds [Oikopleura dioica]